MFADLGFDPARGGCQSYEATDFLTRPPRFDPRSHLILWQVGVIGDAGYSSKGEYRKDGLQVLADLLTTIYPDEHEAVLYLAPIYNVCAPQIDRLPLRELPKAEVSLTATLYVPPLGNRAFDQQMVQRLGLSKKRSTG